MTNFIDNTNKNQTEITEFKKVITFCSKQWEKAGCSPITYNYVELIAKNWKDGLDLMFAWSINKSDGNIYLGHWNGGN